MCQKTELSLLDFCGVLDEEAARELGEVLGRMREEDLEVRGRRLPPKE